MRLLVLWMLASTALAKKPKVVEVPPPEPEPIAAPVVVDPDPLDDLDLEPAPLWANPYAKTLEEQGPYLAITKVMARESFTRLQAIEVQDALRDTVRAGMAGAQTPLPQAYADAVAKVRGGQLQSGLDAAKLAAAPFVVAFDLDETLLDQRYPTDFAATCSSLHYDGKKYLAEDGDKYIQLAPAWEEAFKAVRESGGLIVIFSANVDDRVRGITTEWTWEGKSISTHPDIAGILSNGDLIQQGKDEDKKPVIEPSKDLRLLDSTLEKVILVDDNPTRTFQPANVRVTRKFQADLWCDPSAHKDVKHTLGAELKTVAAEIREAAAWMKGHGGTFRQAYLPYTQTGRVALDALMAAKAWDRKKAMAFVRDHIELVDTAF